MRAKSSLGTFAGSVAVYVVVAACGAASDSRSEIGARSGDSEGGTDAWVRAAVDALTDPVPQASADPAQSGSRLKVKRYLGTDGSSSFAGMYDSQLATDCIFVIASDGTTRCLPVADSEATVSGFYSDAACTVSLASITACTNAPGYAFTSGTANCGYSYRAFPITGPFTGTVYSMSSGNCAAIPSSSVTSYKFFALGSELPPSAFVQATVQVDP